MGSTFWPLNPSFIPFMWPFAVTEDPTLRVYGLTVVAALTIFVAALAFFASLRLRPDLAVGGAWLSFVAMMLQTPDFLTGTDPLISVALTYICLAILVETGHHGPIANIGWFLGYQLCFTILIFAHPAWHLIGLPLLAAIALAIILGAERRAEATIKIVAVAAAFVIHAVLGSYYAIYYLITDTARVLRADAFQAYAHIPYLAGHLFHTSATDILWGVLLIVGLGVGGLSIVSDRPRLAKFISAAMTAGYAFATLGGLWFLYSGRPWPGPKPSYMLYFAYPLEALFAILGLRALCQAARAESLHSAAVVGTRRLGLIALAVAALLGWHLLNSPTDPTVLVVVIAISGFCVWLVRRKFTRIAVIVAVLGAYVGIHANAVHVFGPWAGFITEGSARMAIRPNPLVAFLADKVGLQPNAPFRGYADDAYARPPSAKGLIDEIITQWAGNWQRYNNGMKLFNWNASDIPTLTAYSPYIKPLYFTLFSGLLNASDDRHTVNYLTISHPDLRILQLLGLRYLVRDRDSAPTPEARIVMTWEKFRLDELPNPNLASYTPTKPINISAAGAALTRMRDPAFDPTQQVLLTEAPAPEGLIAAPPARISFERGGFHIKATSSGRSLIVVPIEYSHCLVPQIVAGDRSARLIRVNLVQTGLLFEGTVDMKVRWQYWPLTRPACGRLDYDDSVRLLAAGQRS
jgi:hypothetical protein